MSESKDHSSGRFYRYMLFLLVILTIVLALSFLISFNIIFKVEMPQLQTFNFSLHNQLKFDDSFRGSNPESNITFVLFSDFNCPACIEQYPILKQLMSNHPEVNFLFKHLISSDDSEGLFAAQAFECAKLQGKEYELADFMFMNKFYQSDVFDYLKTVDIDMPKFVECLNSTNIIKLIQADVNHASFLKVKGTPTIFINGIRIEGVHDYGVLDELIINENKLGEQ